ncbi:MAG TPA: hypothetical protein VMW16_14305 [Sedimentisphaerales bacterium]|nr:hypothetical protein [Sedimentisphaerales bacterium]
MKDAYKNPMLYYVLVPVLLALWPILVWAVYLPKAEAGFKDDKGQYEKAEKTITEILTLAPDRLVSVDAKGAAAQFEYAAEVDKVARLCNISSGVELSSKPIRVTKGQKSQNCHVVLKEIEIATFAKFLSTLQLRWPNLQCETMTLTKKKGLPDAWKVDLDFKYYY